MLSSRNSLKIINSLLFVIGTSERIIVYHGQSSSFGYFLVSKCCSWASQVLMILSLVLPLTRSLMTSKEVNIAQPSPLFKMVGVSRVFSRQAAILKIVKEKALGTPTI